MARPYTAETSGQCQDIGEGVSVGATLNTGVAFIGIHCNVSGTYRIYAMDGTDYEELYLVAGGSYGYVGTRITDTSGSALTDGAVIAIIA